MIEQKHEHNEPCICIPVRVLSMLDTTAYLANFWVHVQSGKTHEAAFYACEDELSKYQLPAKYTSFESFRVAKSRYLSKDNGPNIRFV